AAMPSGFCAIARGAHQMVSAPAKMGRAFLRRAYGNLRCRNSQPYSARLGNQFRNHGVVAAKMVETSVGSNFYRGFHVHWSFAGSTDTRLGPGTPGKSEAPRH